MYEDENEVDKERCNYHLCRKKTKLYRCKYCGRYFCKEHIKPKLVLTKSSIESVKDPVLKDKLYQEWRREDGHPDPVWTEKFWNEIKQKEENERKAFEEMLNKLSAVKYRDGRHTSYPFSYDHDRKDRENHAHTLRIRIKKPKLKHIIAIFLVSITIFLIISSKDKILSFFGLDNLFHSSASINTSAMNEIEGGNLILLCKESANKFIEREKIRATREITSVKLIDSRIFDSPQEAEKWAREWVSPWVVYELCKERIVWEKTMYGIDIPVRKPINITKIVALIYEIRFTPPDEFGNTKITNVIYCDEFGNILEKSRTGTC